MRLSGFKWVRSMNSVLGLCLCLVLIGLTTAGAIVYTNRSYSGGMLPDVQVCKAEPLVLNDVDSAPAAIGGNKPVIQVFEAAPMVLDAPDSAAVYTFKVKLAKNVQISEAGTNIRDISNPSGATLQGIANGLPASAITPDDSGKFICTIVASNEYGTDTKALELSIAEELQSTAPPAGATDNKTEPRSPKWLAQLSLPPISARSTSATPGSEPVFFKCPDGCPYCLTPDDAASRGFTKKCSDERCYYSPDEKQNWWCYSEPVGYCCKAGQAGQVGQVVEATKSKCAQTGGAWYLNQTDAIQACQPVGFCCRDGQIYSATRAQCAQVGGSYWSTNQAEAMRACQPVLCWCCLKGVSQTTQAQCIQSGGTCYSTQSQADAGCRQTTPTTPKTPYLR